MRRRELGLAGLAGLACGLAGAQVTEPGEVVEWPVVSLLDGGTLTPASWLGRPAVLVFWATWCPYCKRHNAHLDKLFRATEGAALRVLGVALETDADAVRRYMAVNDYSFPVALDAGLLRRRLTPRRVIPMTCSIDRQGRLIQAIAGEMSEEDMLRLAQVLQRAVV